MVKKFRVPPETSVSLKDYDPDYTAGYESADDARDEFKKLNLKMIELQELMYAQKKHALLIILQAMDAGGKDGTIKNVMRGINPQSCVVHSFKGPSEEERSHDFLWRIHKAVPPRGSVGIFNRSHYEDVLVTRVHGMINDKEAKERFERINEFEELLYDSDVAIVKFFLYISKDEQKKRLQERLDDKEKHWKFSPNDLKERKLWGDYMNAFEDVFSNCSKKHAPWYIIPSNKKWFRNLAVAEVIVDTMEDLKMHVPKPAEDYSKVVIE
ncbi:polyphosphate kinase 2 family protein [bacterium]|nr:polyphosphate kinase 2 family protein [bacterium]